MATCRSAASVRKRSTVASRSSTESWFRAAASPIRRVDGAGTAVMAPPRVTRLTVGALRSTSGDVQRPGQCGDAMEILLVRRLNKHTGAVERAASTQIRQVVGGELIDVASIERA